MFGEGVTNFDKFFLESQGLAVFLKVGSSLFHSITVDRIFFFWKSHV